MSEKRQFARELRKHPTDAEKLLWSHLRGRRLRGFKFRRQEPIRGFFADFLCHEGRLIIELDGGQHAESADQDRERTNSLKESGFRVIRFWNHEVLRELHAVLERI